MKNNSFSCNTGLSDAGRFLNIFKSEQIKNNKNTQLVKIYILEGPLNKKKGVYKFDGACKDNLDSQKMKLKLNLECINKELDDGYSAYFKKHKRQENGTQWTVKYDLYIKKTSVEFIKVATWLTVLVLLAAFVKTT